MIWIYRYLIAHCNKRKRLNRKHTRYSCVMGRLIPCQVLGGAAVILSGAIKRGNIIQSDAIKWT